MFSGRLEELTEELNQINVKLDKTDDIVEYEKVLNDIKESMEKAQKKVCNIVWLIATCIACSLIASGLDETDVKEVSDKGKDSSKSTPTRGKESGGGS